MNSPQTCGKAPARWAAACAITWLLSAGAASAQQYTISTIAGIPQVKGEWPPVGTSGPTNTAQLFSPSRIAVDSKGNYYIADFYTDVVSMVTVSTATISQIAGNGVLGFGGDNGPGLMANISDIHGIAVDSAGNVYLSDTSNSRIRKVDTSGNITTFAGNGTQGYSGDGGAASAASLWFPAALAFDNAGNLYVTDYGNSTVRQITPKGTISTVAGTGGFGNAGDGGPASKALLASPVALAIDSANNLYIGDVAAKVVRKVSGGNISTLASGVAPQSMVADKSGNLYFVDGLNSAVYQILPSGAVLTIAGIASQPGFGGDGSQATLAQLNLPQGIAIDASGNLYIADSDNDVIREMTSVGFSVGAVTSAAGAAVQGSVAPGEIVTLFGSGLGPAALTQFTAANGSIGSTLAGTQVTFNGFPAPLIYTSSTVVAAIVPYELQNASTADIAVSYQGNVSATTVVPIVSAAPAIFTANSAGSGQAAAVNADGSLNGAANPAKLGSFLSIYITGDGQSNPGGVDGKIAAATPYPQTVLPVTVTIGGQPAVVSYAGATPTTVAGLTQVNVQIPVGIAPGTAVPVTVSVGGIASQAGVTLSIE